MPSPPLPALARRSHPTPHPTPSPTCLLVSSPSSCSLQTSSCNLQWLGAAATQSWVRRDAHLARGCERGRRCRRARRPGQQWEVLLEASLQVA